MRSQLQRGSSSTWCQSHILVTHSFHGCGQALRSSKCQTPFNEQRSELNQILNTSTICHITRGLSRMPACWMTESSSEPREASGVRESNLVLYKRHGHLATSTYSISSTVIAKGLCQWDRKTKLLNLLCLPPAFQGLWESVQGCGWATGIADTASSPQKTCSRYVSFLWTRGLLPLCAWGGNLWGPWGLNNWQGAALAGTAYAWQAPHRVTKHSNRTRNGISSKE